MNADQATRLPRTVALTSLGWTLAAAIVLAAALTTDHFLTAANFRAILASASVVGIAALGATIVMIAGGMVSMATATCASLAAMIFIGSLDTGLAAALAAALAFGALSYALIGWLIGAWAVNPVILTIAAASLLEGLVLATTDGALVTSGSGSLDALNATVAGVPVSVPVFAALAVLVHLGLTVTPWGRRIHLIGASREVARVAGLRLGRITALAFAAAGTLTAIAGVFLGALNTGASLGMGGNLTFDAIAAALVGGTAISGGRGSALRTLGGAVVIAAISDLLLLRGFSGGAQICVKGLLVLVVVVVVHLRSGQWRQA